MSNKIIRLESLSLMDHDENLNDGSVFQTTRIIEVGHPYDEPKFREAWDGSSKKYNLVEHHSDRDVVSIDCIRDLSDSDGYSYIVELKDGNELSLPIHAFIVESKGVTDDDD
ncbi:hypothetical protein [Lacticaseibacillus paracasei]|uniref:hypothetical protein n=1 Tax=Lacticaseibacillus paracasei TaxID=1597 RepID=UPI000F0B1317|nr:hypothetical protein [Lacticaseibacillus paracasei]RNE19128.1 hypothetical protein FAM3257_02197 [Lacticaseibacillus paracasei]TLQ35199.1 hypothetical protein FEZ40_11445 [Lacticaseibacillus paracasei]